MTIRCILPFFMSLLALTSLWGQGKLKKPYQLYEAAESVYNYGKFNEAIQLLNQCLTVDPGFSDGYALRASAKEQLNDLPGALTDYSIYLEQIPENPDVLLSRAILRFKIGFMESAREDFNLLLTLNSTETNTVFFKQNMSVDDKNPAMTTATNSHHAYVFNYLGLIELKLKNVAEAINHFDAAIRLDSKEPDYFVNRGIVKTHFNDSSALMDFERALLLNPNHTLAQHNVSALKEKLKQSMTLEERLTQTIEADSALLYPYLERAQQRYESGQYKGALDDYLMALKIDNSNVEIWLACGLCREKLKDYTGAFSDYTKAIDLKEGYAKAWLNRGNVLLKLDRDEDAIEDYNVALLYNPEYILAFYNRAMARIKLKNNVEACVDLKKAEKLGMKIDEKMKLKICSH
jgi:tetratricopeptide (TPR) repeat protein